MFDQKWQQNITLWTRLFDDEQPLSLFGSDHQEQHYQIVSHPDPLIPIDCFISSFITQQSNLQLKGPSILVSNKYEYLKQKDLPRDRNTPKGMMRIFLLYHLQVSGEEQYFPRAVDIRRAFEKYCQSKQEDIKLTFYKYVFNQSAYRKRNRQIFLSILSNKKIIEKQVLNNGNVKYQGNYIYSIKIMKLRCRNGFLCERSQTR